MIYVLCGRYVFDCKAFLFWLILGREEINWCVYVYGQVLLNIDCALRSLDQFKYLTFLDDDEFIVPIKVSQLKLDFKRFYHSHKNMKFLTPHMFMYIPCVAHVTNYC